MDSILIASTERHETIVPEDYIAFQSDECDGEAGGIDRTEW
jgi:hypothetical protein